MKSWVELEVAEGIERAVAAFVARQRLDEEAKGAPPPILPRVNASGILCGRRARARFLPADLFGEPGWDMLLDLHHQAQSDQRVSVSSLCIAAAVPAGTALRWIGRMVGAGVIERGGDPHDRRRSFVRLAPATTASLDRYFEWLGGIAS